MHRKGVKPRSVSESKCIFCSADQSQLRDEDMIDQISCRKLPAGTVAVIYILSIQVTDAFIQSHLQWRRDSVQALDFSVTICSMIAPVQDSIRRWWSSWAGHHPEPPPKKKSQQFFKITFPFQADTGHVMRMYQGISALSVVFQHRYRYFIPRSELVTFNGGRITCIDG